jgi:lipopolysaccharide transport system ATP-binding protein
LTPTSGELAVNGRVAALLELGSGFNPEYSGRDNVMLNGLLLGLSRSEVEQRFDDIASFADIGDVLHRPVKTYSSGMLIRLAFAVQVALEPDVLIVDEALSVGDYFFQQKCFTRLRKMRDNGLTLLFVSHDMSTVRDTCERVLYLKQGQQVYLGDAQEATRRYFADGRGISGGSPLPSFPSGPHANAHDRIAAGALWSRAPAGRPRDEHCRRASHTSRTRLDNNGASVFSQAGFWTTACHQSDA